MKLTQHFQLEEFNKEKLNLNDWFINNIRQLALYLECVRIRYNKPIIITSGVRSSHHNKEVGGSPTSSHLLGKAVDITVKAKDSNGNLLTDEQLLEDFNMLAFHACRTMPAAAKFYYEIHAKRFYIHLQFGEKDTSPLNLLQFFPFTPGADEFIIDNDIDLPF